jgi:pyruvate/2-oxoglutarate dehydrogenase complex dihydrolipoamide dehydrogenase (E3) component
MPKPFGLPQVDLPPVDFRQVADRIRSVVDTIQKHDSEERFCRLGAKVVFGQPRFVDEHAVTLNGKTISAAKWVIATGSSPVVPPIPGLADTPHLTNREIFYMDALPGSMIILGAGPIGIEMAQAFNRFGTKVTVIDRSSRILGKEDKDMADGVMQVLAAEGVAFVLEASIEQVAGSAPAGR